MLHSSRNSNDIIFLLFACFLYILLFGLFNEFDRPFNINTYRATTNSLSYEFGFIRRGIIGTILYPILKFISWDFLFLKIFSYAVFATFLTIFLYYIYQNLKLISKPIVYFAILFIISSPAGPLHFYLGLGRQDVIGFVFSMACFVLVLKGISVRSFCLVLLFSIVGILNNEGFILTNAPTMLLLWAILLENRKEERKYIVLFLLAILFIVVIVALFGRQETVDRETLISSMQTYLDFGIDQKGVEVIYSNLRDNIVHTYNIFISGSVKISILSSLFMIFPTILYSGWIGMISWQNRERRSATKSITMLAFLTSPLTVLPLFALGVDYARWFAVLGFNSLLISIFLLSEGKVKSKIDEMNPQLILLLVVGIIHNFTVGPLFHKNNSFNKIHYYFEKLVDFSL